MPHVSVKGVRARTPESPNPDHHGPAVEEPTSCQNDRFYTRQHIQSTVDTDIQLNLHPFSRRAETDRHTAHRNVLPTLARSRQPGSSSQTTNSLAGWHGMLKKVQVLKGRGHTPTAERLLSSPLASTCTRHLALTLSPDP